jgi:hypothetical protein
MTARSPLIKAWRTSALRGSGSLARTERILFLGALGMLVVSAVLGDSLGAGAVDTGGPALRAHVHAGSLGWLTLAVLAVAAGMAGGDDRPAAGPARLGDGLSVLTVVTVAAFVIADAAGRAAGEAWTGAAALGAILALAGWLAVAGRRAGTRWTAARLGMAGSLVVLIAGSVIGAASAATAAGGDETGAASLASAHSAAVVVPFVILAVTSVLEWSASPSSGAAPVTTAGLVQVGALLLAAGAVIAGALVHDLALVEANIPLELGGIVIFLVRVGPPLLAAGWLASGRIWLVISTVALAVDVGLFAHVVFEIGRRRYVSIDTVPEWLLFTVDHVTFVAVGTTAVFGAIAALAGRDSRWPGTDAPAAAGLVLGLVATAAGIGAGSAPLEKASAAVLGVSVLLAVVVAALRVSGISRRLRT